MGDHHHDLSPVYHSPIEPINCLLRLVLVLVPHKREPSGVTSPAWKRTSGPPVTSTATNSW